MKPMTMCLSVVAILLLFDFNGVLSQTWIGIFTTDSQCTTSSCCCFIGNVTITSTSSNSYSVSSSVSGVCGGLTTFSGVAYTNGYSGWMLVGSNNDSLVLSSDSSTIALTNPTNSACSGAATRNNAINCHANVVLLFAATSIGLFMNAPLLVLDFTHILRLHARAN